MIILIIFVAERDKYWIWRELTSPFAVKAQNDAIFFIGFSYASVDLELYFEGQINH